MSPDPKGKGDFFILVVIAKIIQGSVLLCYCVVVHLLSFFAFCLSKQDCLRVVPEKVKQVRSFSLILY